MKVVDARVPAGATIRFGTTEITVNYDPPAPPDALWEEPSFRGLVGSSTTMREVFAQVAALAATEGAVLFNGEAGTGKHALARALHDASPRAGSPFVVLECAALPNPVEAAEIIEEALRNAEGGTLLLDEPAELPISIQRELIPPLDAKAFRIMATTTRDLRTLVNQNAFREGLYFRLAAGATVNLPPLRERITDLPVLLEHFLGDRAAARDARARQRPRACAVDGQRARARALRGARPLERRRVPRLSGAARALRRRHPDLRDGFDLGSTVEAPALDTDQAAALDGTSTDAPRLPAGLEPWFETGFKEFRERWIELGEREYLRRLMKRTNRSSGAASREAGLERTYLYRLLKKHGA